ncbi:MAG: glycosyltransferase family 4 protein [Dehalococcoidales bacterium]|nr:glycosyltransferase family 4 protein [Dehalococcoidales bacterium]
MRILHKQFDTIWSWTEIAKGVFKKFGFDVDIEPSYKQTDCDRYDVIVTQQPFMMRNVEDRYKVISRIGTNSLFEQGRFNMNEVGKYMSECYAIIATNKFLYNEAKKYNDNVVLIPNGLDLDDWAVVPKKTGKFTVGFVGNIGNPAYRAYKGFDFVDQACKELDIPLETALYGKAQIPHDEIRDRFYSQISCIVHPTEGEGCSNTIMEALACGIPVITTKTAGFHGEMLEHGKNVLFCERSSESVKECIERLINDRQLYETLRTEGRKFAEKYHNVKRVARNYEKVIQACYKATKNRVLILNPNKGVKMKVKALKSVFLNGAGKRARGEVFELPKDQALRLNGVFVEILDGKKAAEPEKKAVAGPVMDKMVREPDKTKDTSNPLKCPYCPFVAKTALGLAAHMRKHKK